MSDTPPDLALYVGEAGNALGDGTDLIPHVSVVEVSRGEAEQSDRWQPVTADEAIELGSTPLQVPQNPVDDQEPDELDDDDDEGSVA